jgi:hypothetical protein
MVETRFLSYRAESRHGSTDFDIPEKQQITDRSIGSGVEKSAVCVNHHISTPLDVTGIC